MTGVDARLFDIFEFLRRRGVPIGLGDYRLAVEVLAAGIGLDGMASFRLTLGLLWAKSDEDGELLDEALALYARPLAAPPRPGSESAGQPPAGPQPPAAGPQPPAPVQQPPAAGPQPPGPETAGEIFFPEPGPAFLEPVPLLPGEDAPEPSGTYLLTPRLPVERREMAAIWRHLRRPQRTGPRTELDVEATIDRFSRAGIFLGPILQAPRRNQARLLCLVDEGEAMEPFAPLVDALLESARRGGLLGRMSVYYFDGVPGAEVRSRGSQGRMHPVEALLASQPAGTSALVVSEAGAALGGRDDERVADTRAFLAGLIASTYRAAWLNPLPAELWPGTPAAAIARLLPMYPLAREGLIDAVDILRGHPFPPGVGLYASH